MKNPELDLAWKFVEETDRNIFLTGKAGTGKTTFLHKIKTEFNKRKVVVAPTGVAAINAKGVTIHSFFQMPFGPIVPGEIQRKEGFKHKFSKIKIDIIRSLDLLIIDEISMVRADLLDGIDQVLRRYRDKTKVFGGVQVLMIGDLQQLAPIIKPYEWELLKPHYENAYFFSSNSFKQSNAIKIELKHIYRQDDEKFINILNEIRNNSLSEKSIEILNQRYQPDFNPKKEDGYITLTTHNNKANTINQAELDKIPHKPYEYKAEITGKFNEYAYPTADKLTLKLDSQVMFIKNDSSFEKQYYNGKIGKITAIGKDFITVKCPDDNFEIEVKPETWENVSYTINPETKEISEKIAGSFTQIPLRLAWAITIHKSQGLTFEKAIIDAEASFAHGQTYVALSRCKTLEGIVLKTPIHTKSIISDKKVTSFTDTIAVDKPNIKTLKESKKQYQLNCIADLFHFYPFLFPLKRIIDIYYKNKSVLTGNIIEPTTEIKNKISDLLKISNSFKNQLAKISEDLIDLENNPTIQQRIQKGIAYFLEETTQKIKIPFEKIAFETDNKQLEKDLTKQFDILDDFITAKLSLLNELQDGFSISKYLEIRAKTVIKIKEKPKKKRKIINAPKHAGLFENLRELRLVLSNADDVPPYTIFTQKSLLELCEYLPETKSQLLQINGFGKKRVEKYGSEILEIIKNYKKEKGIQQDFEIDFTIETNPKPKQKKEKGYSQKSSLELFKQGKTIDEIAKERELAKTTIESHLASFIPTNEINITDLISKEKLDLLKELIPKTKYESLSELKQKLNDKYSYFELRLVTKFGVKS